MSSQAGICVVFLTLIAASVSQVIPPGSPVITSPDTILFGDRVTLTCTVTGGSPTPTVKWLRDNIVIDDSQTNSGNQHINEYTFTASADEHLEVFECQSENGVLQNPLSRTIFVQVNRSPVTPVLTGPSNVMANTNHQWTCTSTGGYPAQTLQMRIENSVFPSNQVTVTSQFDTVQKSYTVTGVLSWNPQMANNGQILYCDVFHPETQGANNPQTVQLPLTVQSPLAVNAPVTYYNPTVGQSLNIQCVVTSGTATSITWLKGNQVVNIGADGRLSGGSPASPSMQITATNTADAGIYKCQATDGSNTVQTADITVEIYTPLALNAPVTFYSPTIGQTLVINCVVTVGSPTSITWTKNGQTLNIAQDGRLSGGSPGNLPLTISGVQRSDEGTYICQGADGRTNTQTNAITVSTYVALALNAPVTSYTPTTGQTLTIDCVVTAGTPTSITWTKNGQTLDIANDGRLSGGSPSSLPLVITGVQVGDSGTYICKGSDGTTDTQTDPITVNVYVPLALNAPVTSYTPTIGQTLSINCIVTAGSPTSITWTKNGQTVNIANDGRLSGGSPSNLPLVITGVQSGDAGTYQCQGSDGTSNAQTNQILVTVYVPLALNAPVTFYTPTIGQTLSINCVVTAGSPTSITWFKNGQVVNINTDGRLSGGSPNNLPLVISGVQSGDAGTYQCQGFDGTTTSQTNQIAVNVYVPLALNAPVTSYTPTVGQTLSIDCVVTAGSPTSITWTKNGQTVNIANDGRLSGGSPSNLPLVITGVQSGDSGTYQCQGSDGTTSTQTNQILVTVYVPLALNAPVTSYTPTVGQTLSINCIVTAGSPTSITWYKNGQSLNINNDARLSGGSPNNLPLVISGVQPSDGGTYQCQGSDGTRTAQTSQITVNVYVPLALSSPVTSYTPTLGQTVSLNCIVTAGSPNSITWSKNGQTINIASNGRLSGGSPSNPPLVISQVQTGDSGTYQCQGTDGTTNAQAAVISVNVYVPLELNAPVTTYTPTIGQTVTINCVVTAGTPTSITWTKNGQTLNIASDGRLSGGSANSLPLVISSVQTTDGGTYICQGSDGTTSTQTNQILVTVYVPLELNAPVTTYTPTIGQTVTINCVVTAGTPTSITWTKNGQTLNIASDGRLSGGSANSLPLVISSVQTTDGGTYICQGSDGTTSTQTNQILVTVYVPLALNAPITSYTPTTGDTLTINCVVTAGTPTSITWYKNGQTINIASDARLSGGSSNSLPLVISGVQSGDAGSYQCQGSDGTTTDQTQQITVTVYVPLELSSPVTFYTPTTGQTLSLNCAVTAGSPTSITWYKNGQSINIANDARLSGGSTSNPPLVISQAQSSDSGTYQCRGTDGTTNAQADVITVTVYVPLALNAPVTSYTPTAGQTLIINCVVTAGSPTSITWIKNGQTVNINNNARISGGSPSSLPLVISGVQTSDGGTYECQGSDGTTSANTNQILVTVYVPLELSSPVTLYTPTTGQTVSLNCIVTTGTPTSITWYKNGQQININNDARLSAGSASNPPLVISQAQSGDSGTYQCRGTDGTTNAQADVIVVNVYVPLALNAPVTSYTPTVGQTLSINCVVTAGTPTSITWTKNGQTVNLGSDGRLSGSSANNPPLVITGVQPGDAGSYQCQGSDGTNTAQTSQITVTVYVPLALNSPITTYTPTLGQTVSLNCEITAGSPTSITWYKNGQQVNVGGGGRYSGGSANNPPLVISQTQASDTGNYQCQGTDGTTNAKADLIFVNVYVPLAINAPVTAYTPTSGQTLNINCVVTAGAPTSITWTKNGQNLNVGSDPRLSGGSPNSPALMINGVQTSDAGSYQCQGNDGTNTAQTSQISVTVYVPLALSSPVTSYTPTAGQTISLNCVVTAGSPTSITWYKNGRQVGIANDARLSGGSPNSLPLVITQTQAGDSGSYQCQGNDGTTTAKADMIFVDVQVPLDLNAPVTSYTPTAGQALTINCIVTAGTPTSITWTKNGQTINIGSDPRLSGGSPNNIALLINGVQTGDAGSYQCQGSDGTTNAQTSQITVTVYVPLDLDSPVTSYSPTVGDTLTLNCIVTAGSPTSVTWYKNGQPINIANDARLSGGSSSNLPLTISQARSTDTGNYQCKGNDGTTNAQADLIFVDVYVPLQVNAPITSYSPETGKSVTLNCVVTQGTANQIKWYKNNQLITLVADTRLAGGFPMNPSLTINDVTMNDGGSYSCEALDGQTTVKTNTITVVPMAPLKVNSPQTVYTPSQGDTISLTCTVTSGTASTIKWYKNNQQIVMFANPRYTGGNQNVPSLTITNIQSNDAGNFQCEGNDAFTTDRADVISVMVQVPLAVVADITSYTPTTEETVTLNCRVTSGTPTSISWSKNSQRLNVNTDARLSGSTVASPGLTISDVKMTDAGNYECEASDGTSTAKTNNINVAPTLKVINEEVIITDILTGYNKLVRPTTFPDIDHSLHPTRIVECDGKNLVIQGYTCMYWTDERLSWTRGQESVSLPSDYIWLPDAAQEGEKPDFYKAPVWSADKAVVTKDGRVSFCPQGIFTAHNCVEKAGEKHQCTMKFRSWSYDKLLMDITLPVGRESVDLSGLEVHDKCELVNKCAVRNEKTYACCGNRLYPDITYTLVWQRKRNFCVNLSEQPTCNA